MVRKIVRTYAAAYDGLSKEVWILSLALFINRCGAMVLAFLTLYLTTKLGFTMFQAGAIFSIWGLGSLVGAFLGGKMIKPFGAIPTQIIGLTLAVPFYLAVPLFTSWLPLAITVFLFSVFSECVRPASYVAVSQFTPDELTTRAFGLQRMAVNLGYSIGPAVGGILATFNYHLLFIVDGITTGLGAVILVWFFGFRKYAKDEEAAKRQRLAEESEVGGSPLRDRTFVVFMGLILAVSLIFFQFHATYPKYLEEYYALNELKIGILFSVNTLIIVALEMILLDKVRGFSLLRTIGWGCLLACFGFGLLPLGTAYWFCILSMVVITFGEMFMFPVASGYVANRSKNRDQGKYMSSYAMMYSIAGIIAPALGTTIYEYNPHLLWLVSFGIGLAALGGFYLLDARTNGPSTNEPESEQPVETDNTTEETSETLVV